MFERRTPKHSHFRVTSRRLLGRRCEPDVAFWEVLGTGVATRHFAAGRYPVGVAISANPRCFGKSGPIDTGTSPIRINRRRARAATPPPAPSAEVMYHAPWPPRSPLHPRPAAM